ncbi:MAG: GTPase [Chloroflexota bacterium]
MPTNLPPDYYKIEEQYKQAQTQEEKIELLETMISTIPKHKGTDHLRADLRRRLSKLKEQQQSGKKTGGPVSPYLVDKEGAGQVVVIGENNVGKSALVKALTNANPDVSPNPFTTWQPTPGMMIYKDVQIQIIDTPPIDREFVEPDFYQLLRRADLILLMTDLTRDPIGQLEKTIEKMIENRIIPAHLKAEYEEIGNKYIPLLVLCNKNDNQQSDENYSIFCELIETEWPCVPISVTTGRRLEEMQQRIYQALGIMRIFSKAPGKDVDMSAPFVMNKDGTIDEFAIKLHKDFYEKLKSAKVWGSTSFDGQMVSRDYVLQDGDIVELKI